MHRPDRWIITKTVNGDVVWWRILSGWSGGYLDGDSWRMSSPMTSIDIGDDVFTANTETGSQYTLRKTGEGITSLTASIFARVSEEADSQDDITFEEVTIQEAIDALKETS